MQANHEAIKRLLLTARGQLDGLLKMVEEDRYCMDISNQLLATTAVLKKTNQEVLKAHLEGCVRNALSSEERETKIDEIVRLLDKLMK
ncbi:MAG: metal-sensing transcriptional repressor [Clostridia bacterium]|nr:metal-sensing transcriptional repressor [Clostridia bacterium]